jgi:hypothetical protein
MFSNFLSLSPVHRVLPDAYVASTVLPEACVTGTLSLAPYDDERLTSPPGRILYIKLGGSQA